MRSAATQFRTDISCHRCSFVTIQAGPFPEQCSPKHVLCMGQIGDCSMLSVSQGLYRSHELYKLPFEEQGLALVRHEKRMSVCVQETLVHKLWLVSHGLLLKTHVAIHMGLNMALPSVFAEPSMMQMPKGQVPYRSVMHSMYKDSLILAGVCAVAAASLARFVMGSNLGQSTVAT